MKRLIHTICFLLFSGVLAFAGNPDRQGEAGAAELLLNPWARSAGVHDMSTAFVSGVEAMRHNVAGLGRMTTRGELSASNAIIYDGTGIKQNSLGFATKVGESGAFGVSIVSMSFGDIPVTTTNQPEGTGGTFSPSFFNLGIGYSKMYRSKNKDGTIKEDGGSISVGLLFRAISESIPDLSASGFALDAGVQYVSGKRDNFRLGISLRNIGTPMSFGGEGLTFRTEAPESTVGYSLTTAQLAQDFELPSVLNIGLSYDYYLAEELFLRGLTNFTSNAFSTDQIGVGMELGYNKLVTIRAAYKTDIGAESGSIQNLYTGLAAGISIDVPLKRADDRIVGIDYAYRATSPFKGTHNFSIRLNL